MISDTRYGDPAGLIDSTALAVERIWSAGKAEVRRSGDQAPRRADLPGRRPAPARARWLRN